ncbi:MAG TPA: ABC-F family ATP-binding cassette domain-containing protein [Gaiellales bacterium]|nr:ABC-F family ATP-binding cassette domain-containing protein [Gaiellales bacterium]
MRLIALRGAVKSYGSRTVLQGLDLEVGEGARIGVIGQNGSGKSTLLRILAGMDEPDGAPAVRRKGMTAAYLPQLVGPDPRTPVEICHAARPEIARVERELDEVAARLGSDAAAADLGLMQRTLNRQERLLEEFDQLGGHAFDGTLRGHLRALGLTDDEVARPHAELSGGKRKLVALAACLAREPDLLLLDEPETHLDAVRRSRLEELVGAFPGAVVMVSHDRYLLDETVTDIAELDHGRIRMWPGNYSAYQAARALALEQQAAAFASQQKEIARLEEAIRRYKQWASMVDDRRHTIRARNTQRRINRMDKVERPVLERRRIGLALRSGARGGKRVAELRGAAVAFGEDPVLVGVDLTIFRGERIGVIGRNGGGKSALVKALVGRLPVAEGEVWRGPSIDLGYLAQEHAQPQSGRTPVDALRAQKPCTEEEAVQALLRFLFSYDQCRQPIASLSGGERTRLELVLLMRSGANFLVLDEPTNHLDIDSVEALETAIEGYDGTVVAVSHDRYFLDRIADRIVEVEDGEAHAYEGGYSTWYARHRVPARASP